MIENLLLQQVLLYTRERSKTNRSRSPVATTNSLLVRQQLNTPTDHHLVVTSPKKKTEGEPALCLVESHEANSSNLIENILDQYHQRQDSHSRFDQNLMELIVERNRQRRNVSIGSNTIFHSRLQWLAIGLVIDRLFFYVYFTATIISYFVTLWLIPFSHPNLTINIQTL
jgi:hypothetical protein